ncbi:MAG: hypothetical protein HOO97_09765 [Sideroxydans sp.]|nr:hypothetical protein [Sideroxydans sp.]
MPHRNTPSKKENSGGSDLLAELAGEATQKLKALQSEEHDRQTRSKHLHEALGKIFQFLNPFATHLNRIKPIIHRPYSIDPQTVYNELQWNEAYADYRKQSLSDTAFYDHVSFRVRLNAPAPVIVKRRWNEIESLKKELDAFGLRTLDDLDVVVRSQSKQEFFEARLAPDFLMRIQFQGNYDTGKIDLLCANFDGFGLASYMLDPDTVNQQLLDDIGRFLIGRQESLPSLLSKTRYLPKQAVYR